MKIEAAKNHPVDKKESKNVFKTETSVFNSSNPLKTAEVPAPTTSAFAKILEENRKEKDNSSIAKSDSTDSDTKTSKSEKDSKLSRQTEEKKELEERNKRNGDGDSRRDGDENQSQMISLAALQSQINSASETVSTARSILHIADLERIISTIRTENFQNQKQVTIALKNSVLQGLQIKLTITENGKIKAEFLALNEQIKKQLNLRKKELSEILHNRSALFYEVEIKFQNPDEKD
ncbi:MAG TPA: hypothetical protein VNB22_03280 [Pyrinomonadaceae bacterium]|nr:hypothetical protein [Pyrinomonadaceae bacterium]